MIPASLNLRQDDLTRLGSRYVEQLKSFAPSAKRVTDKMLGNYMQLGLISLILPRAKIIHCHRDPRDTCLSIFKKLFSRGHQYAYDLKELGEYYCIYSRLMEHWGNVLPGHFFDFCYEDLIINQEGETRRLLEYCGLEWNEQCLRYYEHDRPVYTASALQVRTPLTQKTVALWKKYEEGLQPLLSALKPRLQ